MAGEEREHREDRGSDEATGSEGTVGGGKKVCRLKEDEKTSETGRWRKNSLNGRDSLKQWRTGVRRRVSGMEREQSQCSSCVGVVSC